MKRIFYVLLIFLALIAFPPRDVVAQYNNDCSCLANGNCSDAGPGGGYCKTGTTYTCAQSEASCGTGYRAVEQICSTKGPCGNKCIYEQSCATGFCQDNPPIKCDDTDGSFLCGDGGCGSCERLVKTTTPRANSPII